MNILIHIRRQTDMQTLETALPDIPLNVYYVRDSLTLLKTLQQIDIDAIIAPVDLGEPQALERLKIIKNSFRDSSPIICCIIDGHGRASLECDIKEQFVALRAIGFVPIDSRSPYGLTIGIREALMSRINGLKTGC